VSTDDTTPGAGVRRASVSAFRLIEQAFYIAIAAGLTVSGVALLGHVGWTFATEVASGGVVKSALHLLEGVLLVFIMTELIHTIRAILDRNVVSTEPFLIVGIVAAVRRLLVITAQAPHTEGAEVFRNALYEMGTLVLVVIGLGLTIYLLRHTTHSEPPPAHEEESSSS
jgi:uncharacterized membrane protein (DUF373 family)